jgi:anthranilate synthase/aminodeoxychorismate synthase-like glutamine amidotransferase
MILVIDNYDSFTFNLVQILLKNKFAVKVIKNDEWTIDDVCKKQQLIEAFLFSPGPGHPSQAKLCHQILKEFASTHPVLGVCLGHQVIAEYFGAQVVRAERPMHGKVSAIEHTSQGAFRGLPLSHKSILQETSPEQEAHSTLKVVRYHSLIVDEASLPACLEVTARVKPMEPPTDVKSEIMGLRHKTFPIEGWQFHPESILTEFGEQLVVNFFRY